MKPNDVGIEEEKQIVDDALEKVGDERRMLKNKKIFFLFFCKKNIFGL